MKHFFWLDFLNRVPFVTFGEPINFGFGRKSRADNNFFYVSSVYKSSVDMHTVDNSTRLDVFDIGRI